jgi:sterol desaturase/sphingolipid hydroxylase (fatty acid hydroxylase superfamily)
MGKLAIGLAIAALFWLERRYPLRHKERESDWQRVPRNLALAATTGAVVKLCERPIVEPLAKWVAQKEVGLLPSLRLHPLTEKILGLLLMDYTLYWWHFLSHRVPFLWRSHQVHHIDLKLDMTTALRFHGLEFLMSIPWRIAQVLIFGIRPKILALWQGLTTAEVLFHHSNLRLPLPVEDALNRFIVTPRMHGIHHSIVEEERNSNFSSGFTVWDVLHGTLKPDIPQEQIEIGVPNHRTPDDAKLKTLLRLPFEGSASRSIDSPFPTVEGKHHGSNL